MKEAVEIKNEVADFKDLAPLGETPLAPAHGIAAIALNMAMKYHDITVIKDGAMYQQYKLEGKNLRELNIDEVFETAIRIEAWLLGSSDRIAKLIVDALEVKVEGEDDGDTSAAEIAAEEKNENRD